MGHARLEATREMAGAGGCSNWRCGLGIPASGNKRERIDRLIDMAALPRGEEGWSVSKRIELFTEDEIRRVCIALGIDDADKASIVRRLAARIDTLR